MLRSSALRSRLLVVALGAAALVSVPARDAAAQEPKPFAVFSSSAEALRDSIVALARAQIGTRYRRGGESPKKGFDCSGLVQYVLRALDVDVPRTARQQATVGLAMPRDTSQLLPGDVLTFGRSKKGAVSHVGIYVGNGRFIHASALAGRVIETPIDRPESSLIKIWRGARRIFESDTVGATLASVATKTPLD